MCPLLQVQQKLMDLHTAFALIQIWYGDFHAHQAGHWAPTKHMPPLEKCRFPAASQHPCVHGYSEATLTRTKHNTIYF